jgi:predicted ATPase/DNA-binding SARP family transcriptional activator
MEVRILGPLEVRVGERPVTIRAGRPRKLLAMLVLRLGERVSTDVLIDTLWSSDASGGSVNALRILVSYLRKALEPAAGGLTVETVEGGYRLVAERGAVDAYRFEAAVAAASQVADPVGRLDRLEKALAAWRGSPLPEVADEEFAQADLQRLHEVRLTALEHRVDALLELGRDADAVIELQHLVVAHPLRERLHAQLMTALYRSGRQAEALTVYERARRRLAEELGLDPGPELRALEQAVLQQSPELGPRPSPRRGGSTADPTSQAPASPDPPYDVPSKEGIPRPLEPLIGRDAELAQLIDLAGTRRLVTLTGPGGAGKTRLAAELAARADTSAWWADLSAADSAESVVTTVAGAMDVAAGKEERVPALVAQLRRHRGLLVLDTCERVRAALRPLLEAVLRECPRLHVLATSRQPIGAPTERVWPVPPLALPDPDTSALEDIGRSAAVQLFVERAANRRPGFRLSAGNGPDVARICHLLDGLPLAIELAAAHAGALAVPAMVRVLDDRLRLLVDEGRDDRQQTLRSTIAWSHELLTDDEARFFERLSVFAGPFPLAAAEAVAGEGLGRDGLELLLALSRQSLVASSSDDRFRLLDTIRAFARERLAHRPEDERATRRRHAAWFTDVLTDANPHSRAVHLEGWRGHLRDALPDLRRALDWCFAEGEDELGARLLSSLWWFWPREGVLEEAATWFPRAKTLVATGSALQADLLSSSGTFALSRGDLGTAVRECGTAAELYAQLGHRRSCAQALLGVGVAHWGLGDYALAARAHEEAAELFDAVGDAWGVAVCLGLRARTAIDAGEPDLPGRLDAAEAAALRSRDDHVLSVVHMQRARLELAAGHHGEAARHARESLRLNERHGHREGFLGSLHLLGLAQLGLDDLDGAAQTLTRALRSAVSMHHAGATAESLDGLALLQARADRLVDAAALLACVDDLRERTGIARTPLTAALLTEARDAVSSRLTPAEQAHARLRGTALDVLDLAHELGEQRPA